MTSARALTFAAAASLFAAPAAFAQGPAFPSASDDSATWSFVWENDYFADTDRNYTNGVRLSYISGFKKPEGVTKFCAESVLGAGPDAGIRRGFAISHSIFTPRDTQSLEPLPDQHPYAGWLYGEYSVTSSNLARSTSSPFRPASSARPPAANGCRITGTGS